MAYSYKTRKRLALLILLVGMPVYVILAVMFMNWSDRTFGRLPIWAEVPLYAALAIGWVLPFRGVFKGIGQADPDAGREEK